MQRAAVSAVVERAPGAKAVLLEIELIGEVDVCFAIEQITEIEPRSFQVNRIDLEVAPIERAVGIVVISFAFALRIFCALNGERYPACRSELLAGVLLVSRQRVMLV